MYGYEVYAMRPGYRSYFLVGVYDTYEEAEDIVAKYNAKHGWKSYSVLAE